METEHLLQKVCETFYYEDGFLKYKGGRCQVKGKTPGWIKPDTKYHCVCLNGKQYKTHRLIFLMFHGYLPKYIDHIDRNKLNNRIENLRETTKSENALNSERSDKGGVSYKKDKKKWRAYVKENGVQKHLGCFLTEKEARQSVYSYRNKEFS